MDEVTVKQILRARGVEDPCERCHGFGWRAYGSGATWRGGMGTASLAWDVCDICWGSGDRHRHGVDLRKLEAEEKQRVAARAAELFAQRTGVTFWTLVPAIEALCAELDRFERQRRPRPPDFDTVARCLAGHLRELVEGTKANQAKALSEAAARNGSDE